MFQAKKISSNLTSYDLMKTLAVLLMIIDHTAYYEFIDSDWPRAIGRLCVPIWFFLIGYANTRSIPLRFWGGAILLVFANFVVGYNIFELNVLFSLILARLTIDYCVKKSLQSQAHMILVCTILTILAFPTYFIIEYGTMGIILAMLGYFVRHKTAEIDKSFVSGFMIFSALNFIILQQLAFGFTAPQFAFMAGGILVINILLLKFRACDYPDLTQKLPGFASGFLRLFGRRTLEIYVIHLIIFKVTALIIGVEGYALLDLRFFSDDFWMMFEPVDANMVDVP